MARRASSIDRDRIYDDLRTIAARGNSGHFLEDFMGAYYYSKAALAKMNESSLNSTKHGSYIQKGDFHFKEVPYERSVDDVFVETLAKASTKERFIIATNYKQFMARDNNTKMSIDIPFSQLADHYEFFFPLIGIEKHQAAVENVADVKAAQKMAMLFDEIKRDNLDDERFTPHVYSSFLTRLLFSLFADDTKIFEDNQFENSIGIQTDEDGKNLASWLEGLFAVLDLPQNKRLGVSHSYLKFPYVNGGLFREKFPIPRFTYKSRQRLLECCASDWSKISPDIFGSMFQGAIDEKTRSELGQHYTSVSNIMKVINPLFLDDLRDELHSIKGNDKKLDAFRMKLSKIKIFDPACGSGNFLIVAYKELCRLEMETWDSYVTTPLPFLSIQLENFYGIEIDDLPCEIARLSLWLAQHQIYLECYEKYGNSNPTLPLSPTGNIVCGNACRLDWEKVCPCNEEDIVYICSNPPFVGNNYFTKEQQEDKALVFDGDPPKGKNDYVCCWFYLAAQYIQRHKNTKCAFVSTNSITQGLQVQFWNYVWNLGVEIAFAYSSFKWRNNATKNAGVIVIIVGLRYISNSPKRLFNESRSVLMKNINGYLIDGDNTVVQPVSKTPSGYPTSYKGCYLTDGGNLIITKDEALLLVNSYPFCSEYIHRLVGADDYLNGTERWCLLVPEEDLPRVANIRFVQDRFDKVKESRLNSSKQSTREILAQSPWKPEFMVYRNTSSIFIPNVSSGKRDYIPMGYLRAGDVVCAPNFVIYDTPVWLFALLQSGIHMQWANAISGKLKSDYRYSNTLCYNTFPFPNLTEAQKAQLEITATGILMEREKHYDMTLAQQYNPDNMPEELREAHNANDLLVDSLYRKSGFESDEERLAELLKRYKRLVEEEK